MTRKALGAIITSVISLVVACAAGVLLLGGGAASGCTAPLPSATALVSTPAGGWQPVGRFDPEQVGHAATIASIGAQMGVPNRGWVIAVATAIQESDLRNLAGGPDDSIGLFQQRSSQGWGTIDQLQDPAYAAGKFYERLLTIPDWQAMALTDVAQAVQRSAFPDAYAKWEDDATALVQQQLANGDVELACSAMTLGEAEPAPRMPDGSWPEEGCTIHPDPTTGQGCVTPRLLHLVQQADTAGFPKPGCYRIDDHGEHPKGRACDWMMTSGGQASGAQKARGDAMATWAVANADRLGITYVIWFRMIWTQTDGWHDYNNPWGGNDPSGWHTNHVHISIR
jgi:hypothetical protein